MSSLVIDSHQHYWRIARNDYGWLTPQQGVLYRDYLPEDLSPLLQRNGVKQTILVQAAATVDETRFLLNLANENGNIAGVVGWVDMKDPKSVALLDELAREPKFLGIRPMLQDISDPEWILDDVLAPAFAALLANNFSFDALITPIHLPVIQRLAKRYPTLRIVIDHGAKPAIAAAKIEAWARDVEKVAQCKNVYCKLSGLVTEAGYSPTAELLKPYVNSLIENFGSSRLMWGSDWPVVTSVMDYDQWMMMTGELLIGVTGAERQNICGVTAHEFYRLGER